MSDKKKDKSEAPLSAAGFGIRFIAALALVLLTFNPSGFSGYHWVTSAIGARHVWARASAADWRTDRRLGNFLDSDLAGTGYLRCCRGEHHSRRDHLVADRYRLAVSTTSVSAVTWIGSDFPRSRS